MSIGIVELVALGAAPAANDYLVMVDRSDSTQAPQGSTKSMLVSDLFTGPTFTGTTALATLNVSGFGTFSGGVRIQGAVGTTVLYVADVASVGDQLQVIIGGAGSGTSLHSTNAGVNADAKLTINASAVLVDFLFGASATFQVTGAFGCNSKSPQTDYPSGGALSAYGAGVNGFDTAGNASALYAMVVAIRAALVANGVMS